MRFKPREAGEAGRRDSRILRRSLFILENRYTRLIGFKDPVGRVLFFAAD